MKLADVIDLAKLQSLMETFYAATGIPVGIRDEERRWVVALGWEEVCTDFHRACAESASRCAERDGYLAEHLGAGGYVRYPCPHGLVDVTFPIVVDGTSLGSFFLGQFFHERPDETASRAQAERYGYDVGAYLDAVRKVRVISSERVDQLVRFLMQLVGLITDLGGENLHRRAAEAKLTAAVGTVEQRVADRTRALREAGEALRESEARYRTLVDLAPVGIVVSSEGRYRFANATAARLFGASGPEVLVGQSWLERLHPDERAAARERSQTEAAGIHIDGVTERFLRFDGTPFDVEVSLLPTEWHGRPARLVVFRDVTERRRQEDELRRLRKAVENSGEVIFLTARDGVITWVNPEFTRLYGYLADEVVGKTTPRILKSGRVPQQEYVGFWRALLARQVVRGDITNKTKDGRLVQIENSASAIVDEGGAILGFLCIQRDVTERNRAATERAQLGEQLLRAQKMEAIGRLAGGVAHDFNNLLSVILGFSGFIANELSQADPMRQDVEEIRKAAQRGAGLARQLLIFSRKELVKAEVIDLNDVVASLEKLMRRALGEDIHLVTVPGPDLWPVRADPGQVDQLLLNMAVNSRDAMPDGGQLTIETANVVCQPDERRPDGLGPGRYVRLTVADTGCGMSPEVAARAFDPFFTTKPAGKGTGLGLSTVYGIIKRAGGDVTLETAPGAGARFEILLPATDGEVARDEGQAAPAQKGRGETILLVEDEDAVRSLAVRILHSAGYKVFDASNGGEALLVCERHPIDLLLTDVVMPKMSGKELAQRLRKERPELRVLYASGYSENSIVHDGVPEAGVRLIEKPFTAEALLAAVRLVLDGSG